jgi:AmiR/NasT family two-component response regulator
VLFRIFVIFRIRSNINQYNKESTLKRVRVLVANRPRLMREMVMTTISDQPDIEIVGEVVNEGDLNDFVEQTQPDVLIVSPEEAETPSGDAGSCSGFIRG